MNTLNWHLSTDMYQLVASSAKCNLVYLGYPSHLLIFFIWDGCFFVFAFVFFVVVVLFFFNKTFYLRHQDISFLATRKHFNFLFIDLENGEGILRIIICFLLTCFCYIISFTSHMNVSVYMGAQFRVPKKEIYLSIHWYFLWNPDLFSF